MHYRKAVVWERAMEIAQEIYRLAKFLPREEIYGMRSQLTRAAVSVPSNIAEGWTRESPREKAHFLAIARGSTAELDTQVTLCERIGWFPGPEAEYIRGMLEEVSRMLTVMRRKQRGESKEKRTN